ncbi:hypothetical protein EV126DRAFT_511453 [Verticillium dahliae]|nr:hypothetical protein EV126DRAFT_511453 [Verticillium dahliae]
MRGLAHQVTSQETFYKTDGGVVYTYQPILNMPFFYNKSVGGRRFGTSIQADRHGVRRGPWRFRIGRFNCFK